MIIIRSDFCILHKLLSADGAIDSFKVNADSWLGRRNQPAASCMSTHTAA